MFELLIAPTITGTAAGLAVAFGIALTKWLSQPRFELRKIGDKGYGVLINRTPRPILLGNSFCMETQEGLLDPSSRGIEQRDVPISRLIVGGLSSRIILLNGAEPGYYVTFTYRPVWCPSRRKNYSQLGHEADSVGPFLWKSPEPDRRFKKWKEKSLLVEI
ncbi:hypothetical protein APT58_08275 [Corynebacterium glutamicum]|nr:hypothetical protein APT58_08275 [Corynebacterium glutamicum]